MGAYTLQLFEDDLRVIAAVKPRRYTVVVDEPIAAVRALTLATVVVLTDVAIANTP